MDSDQSHYRPSSANTTYLIHLPTLLPTSLLITIPKQDMAYLDHHIQSVSILCAFGAPSLSVLFCPLYDVCTYYICNMYVYLSQMFATTECAIYSKYNVFANLYHLHNTNIIMMLTSTPYYPSIICLWKSFYLFMQYIQVSTTIQRSVLLVVI